MNAINATTRVALLSFLCGGLSFWVGARFLAPASDPPRSTAPPLSWERKTDAFGALGHNRKLVFLGDSRIEEGQWPELVGRGDVSNRGISGDTAQWMLRRLAVSVPDRADVVVVQLGVNDLMRGEDSAVIKASMSQILDYLHRKAGRVIFTSIIFTTPTQVELNGKIGALNRELRAMVAQKKLIWVDLNAVLGPHGSLDDRFSNDGLHLNGRGYQAFAALVRPHL